MIIKTWRIVAKKGEGLERRRNRARSSGPSSDGSVILS